MSNHSRKAVLRGALAFAFAATALSGCSKSAPISEAGQEQVVEAAAFYLVRHAEKELEGDDPALSEAGYERANELAAILRDIEFDGIYSSDTRRTRDTAAPTADAAKLDIKIYNPRALTDFAQEFSDKAGNYLIVGHSNTTPQLAEALGGEGGAPIIEETEYDRLYVLTRTDGVVVTDLRRYP